MKNKMKRIFVCMLLIVATFPAVDSLKNSVINSTVSPTSFSMPLIGTNQNQNNNSGPYEGRLRVYIVQPLSRWKGHDGKPYHFSLLDFPLVTVPPFFAPKCDEDISIAYLDTYSKTINWSGFVSKNNVMVIAGVYDARSEIKNSYNDKDPFYAHYLDAAAGARPGETTFNTVNNNFTHTVLVEVATSTKCPYCPIMEDALYNLSKTGDYPFYFVNMVLNKNRYATWFNADSQEGYCSVVTPLAYFDGGYEMLVGGESNMNSYISRINSCGKRDVHQLNLSLSVAWNGFGTLGISIHITNNEEVHYPLKPVAPYSPSDLLNLVKGKEYTFQSHTTDPDGDDVYYMFEYVSMGLDVITESGWLGPYHSGDVINTTHIWNEPGGFYIRVRAKDINNVEGPRSEHTYVSVQ
jgi:hypothetical protein